MNMLKFYSYCHRRQLFTKSCGSAVLDDDDDDDDDGSSKTGDSAFAPITIHHFLIVFSLLLLMYTLILSKPDFHKLLGTSIFLMFADDVSFSQGTSFSGNVPICKS